MLFKQKHLEGIKSGEITLAFRKWEKPAVRSGSIIKTSIGLVKIDSIEPVTESTLTESDAVNAGFDSQAEMTALLGKTLQGTIYKIAVSFFSEDPRIALRENSNAGAEDLRQIQLKLEKLDKYSKIGPWTFTVLKAIKDNPMLRAVDLAQKGGYEKEWLKINIRKLKNLGLTISHETGYSISPLGEKFLEWLS